MMLEKISKKTFPLFLIITGLLMFSAPSYSQEDGGVNSTNSGLIINGGLGYGSTLFGVVEDTSKNTNLGSGPGGGIALGALFNYNIFAFGVTYTRVKYNDMKWDETVKGKEYQYETNGDGYLSTLGFLAGVKAFTEPGDMGHTDIFAGLKFWKAVRDIDYRTVNGTREPDSSSKIELSGKGWLLGFRDFSTFPIADFSLALQTALWYQELPLSKLKIDGAGVGFREHETGGLGFELGAGVAFEDIGMSVIGGVKLDVTGTSFEYSNNGETNIAGAGYAEFFITVSKEFAF